MVGAAQRATRGVVGGLLWEEKIYGRKIIKEYCVRENSVERKLREKKKNRKMGNDHKGKKD